MGAQGGNPRGRLIRIDIGTEPCENPMVEFGGRSYRLRRWTVSTNHGRLSERHPKIDSHGRRQKQSVEGIAYDPDDSHRLTSEPNGPSDYTRVSSKLPTPHVLAEHDLETRLRLVIRRPKDASGDRHYADGFEVAAIDSFA